MIGIPGTGLGGVFYALLVLWMAVREGWLTLRGASNRGRWIRIGSLWALLGSILLVLWVEGWVIKAGLEALPDPGATQTVAAAEELSAPIAAPATGAEVPPSEAGLFAAHALVPAFAAAPFVVLGLLVALLHAARLAYPRKIIETVPMMPARPQRATRFLEDRRQLPLGHRHAEEMEPAE